MCFCVRVLSQREQEWEREREQEQEQRQREQQQEQEQEEQQQHSRVHSRVHSSGSETPHAGSVRVCVCASCVPCGGYGRVLTAARELEGVEEHERDLGPVEGTKGPALNMLCQYIYLLMYATPAADLQGSCTQASRPAGSSP